MRVEHWEPTAEQREGYDRDGYLVLRGLLPAEVAAELRGVIKNVILLPEGDPTANPDPLDPMGDSPAARAQRFRKLANFCVRAPLIWHHFHAGPEVLARVRWFLGDDVLMKFNSCFLKPARTGSATPWHQDNGLWRDGQTEPANAWLALDPATRANGCLQVVPGSHRGEIVPHLTYPDSLHGELPRELVADRIARDGVRHLELAPGDAVFWHSSLWHYSPPNTSDQGRIAIAGVWTTPGIVRRSGRRMFNPPRWVLRAGEVCEAFPPEEFDTSDLPEARPKPWTKVEEPVAGWPTG